MYQFLFKNRLIALAFVAATILSVRLLVGTEDDAGLLTRTTSQIEANVQSLKNEAGQLQSRRDWPADHGFQARTVVKPQRVVMGYTPDEDLVEEAQGRTPDGEDAAPVPEGEIVGEIVPDVTDVTDAPDPAAFDIVDVN